MKEILPDRVRLGAFEIDLRAGELCQDDVARLVLPDQPLQILCMLVEADGEIVTREEIRRRLWSDETVVEFDHSINTAIKKLRHALVDSGDEPHYIGTIAKRGYRLLVPVERISYRAEHESRDSGRTGPSTSAPAHGTARDRVGDRVEARISAKQSTAGAPAKPGLLGWGFVWAVAALLVCTIATAAVLYWRLHRPPKLTEQDTIVLADFGNETGDPLFDDSLKQAVSLQLSQSPFLNILPDRKVWGTLKAMNRSAIEPLTENLAFEVCRRAGSKAVISGSIGAAGEEYAVGLRAVDCNTGKVLAEAQGHARNKETVLQTLDEAALSIREQLGEPPASVRKYATPSAEATMPALEAWKSYAMGLKASYEQGSTPALPFFERAVEIDPNFVVGYVALSFMHANRGEHRRSEEYARKAYELRDKVGVRERLFIESAYYFRGTGELEKAAETYERWLQIYPREVSPHQDLDVIYAKLGNGGKALDMSREAVRLEPDAGGLYENLAEDYMNVNRLDEAGIALKEAQDRKVTSDNLLPLRYELAFLQGDAVQMAQIAAASMGKPGSEFQILDDQAYTEAWYGRFKAARRLTQQAMDSAQRNDAKETAADFQSAAALREAAAGNRHQARAEGLAALKLDPNRIVKCRVALALALAGDPVAAEKFAGELNQEHPVSTLDQHLWLPLIHAAVALAREDARHAVELLSGIGALELSYTGPLYPAYLRGQAYLMLYEGKPAEEEFYKFVDHYGLVRNNPWGALARLGLARAYALEAQTDPAYREKARTAYQNFLTLWKDADPEIPVYKQAKAEYAKLQ